MEQKRNLHKKMHADRVDQANKFIKNLENPQSSSSLDENKNSDNSNSHTSKESLSYQNHTCMPRELISSMHRSDTTANSKLDPLLEVRE